MRGPLVVIGPRIGGAKGEGAAGDDNVAACRDVGRSPHERAGQARKRQCLRHRLGVLELVLDDHRHHETVLEQRIAVVERQLR